MKKIIAVLTLSVLTALLTFSSAFAAAGDFKSIVSTTDSVMNYFCKQYKANALGAVKTSKITRSKEQRDIINQMEYSMEISGGGFNMTMVSPSKNFRGSDAKIAFIKISQGNWTLPGGINIGMPRRQAEQLLKSDPKYSKGFFEPEMKGGIIYSGGVSQYLEGEPEAQIEILYNNDSVSKIIFAYIWM